jgi:hypothetical protein
MININAIIFSKDRASQLHLLLNSIHKNAPYIFNLNVLYTSSNQEFEKGYEVLKEICKTNLWNVNFVKESNFKEDVMCLLKSDYKYTTFFTDDDVVFGSVDYETIEKSLQNDDVFCFSLRLGKNTTYCYSENQNNQIVISGEENNFIYWDWQKSWYDFGYPLSVDGHVFRTKEIFKLSKSLNFSNPNTYEAALQIYDTFPRNLMESYKESKLVGIPVNVVQNVFPNRKGEKFYVSAKELNDRFLNNIIIDLDNMKFENIEGAHQEIVFNYKNL